jgi:alanyl-tRNA synthetase
MEIDQPRRQAIRANHSATHLLHAVLRKVLGEHVTQKGSLVDAEKLRFDFSHGKAVTKEEIAAIEQVVNAVVWQGGAVGCEEMTADAAIAAGAMALFGEKYGDRVRVLSMGQGAEKSYSVELCGGTHVRDVADIVSFKITSEGSVAAGIRRIEATTGEGVRAWMLVEISKLEASLNVSKHSEAIKKAPLKELGALFASSSAELQAAIATQAEANKKLAKVEAEAKKQAALGDGKVEIETIGEVKFIGKTFDGLDPKDLRDVANSYLKQADVVAVATTVEGKASVVVGVNKTHTDKFSAVTFVQKAVEILGGKGGGGKPEMAQGGGPDGDKLHEALDAIKRTIQ